MVHTRCTEESGFPLQSAFLDLDAHDPRPEELVETISTRNGYKLSLLKSYYERDAPSGAVYVFQIVC